MSKSPENSELRVSKEFSERLKELMEENDCGTSKQFAELVGASYPTIMKGVNYGIVPSTTVLLRIADKLEVSLTYLLALSDENDFDASPSPTNFQTRIKELANENNQTFGQVASKLPILRTYFYDWIRINKMPSIEYAIMIAEYFGVSLDYLFGRTDFRN